MSRKTDKNQAILKALLREPSNNSCADCKTAAHPRWASWNLGIFICIRCSGIHRSMGTHISKVKSVDLDTWTDEQVRSMVSWGNDKANQFWESGLPNNYVPDESKIENFIRTKYDLKKWVKSSQIPDPSQLSASQPTQISTGSSGNKQDNRKSLTNGLLDLEFSSPITTKPSQQLPASISNIQVQAPQQQQRQTPPTPQSQFQQPQQAQNRDRPELKKSILSLYSTPLTASNSTPSFIQQPQQQQQQQFPNLYTTPSTASVNQINNNQNQWSSNNSSNTFNSSTSSFNTQQPQQTTSNQWSNSTNQWSSVSSPGVSSPQTFNAGNSNGLDDDLFKNVWK